jgi:hypothetical protein
MNEKMNEGMNEMIITIYCTGHYEIVLYYCAQGRLAAANPKKNMAWGVHGAAGRRRPHHTTRAGGSAKFMRGVWAPSYLSPGYPHVIDSF